MVTQKFVLTIQGTDQIHHINMEDHNRTELTVVLDMGPILQVDQIDQKVIIITFERGEIRFESTMDLLNKLLSRSLTTGDNDD